MTKHLLRTILIMICLIAPGLVSGAFGVSAENEYIAAGDLTAVELTNESQTYTFTPAANSTYAVYAFPQSENTLIRAALFRNGERIAEGEGALQLLTTRLTENTEYTLELTGTGSAYVEIARETLSRSFGNPLLPGDRYSKLITRAGDVHWYNITAAEDAAAILAAAPEEPGLYLRAWLFDETGKLLQRAELLPSGAAVMSAELHANQPGYLRIAAIGDGTGKYTLNRMTEPVADHPTGIALSESELTLSGRTEYALEAAALPETACSLIFLSSSDPAVVRVRPDGMLETTGGGSAVITAYAYGGLRAECAVSVEHVPVEGIDIGRNAVEMTAGDELPLEITLAPANASRRRLTFVTENERVVTVSSRGVLTAVSEGTATVVAITEDGGFTDVVFVTVKPAPKKYRALLVGEQNYASTVDTVRPGSINSVGSIKSLLELSEYETTTLMDVPRDTVIAGIRSVFADAQEGDVSLVYITCHGFYQAGMTFFVMADGSVLSARDLERELRKIPGDIVLLADCCGSGGLLGEAGSTEDILNGITSVFHGTVGAPSVYGSKYRVIASALLDQDSYRISFSDDSEAGMATVFARALCDGAGWSIDRGAQSSMNADANYDGNITLNELATYMSRRVSWYLNLAGGYVQNVRAWPEGDGFVLFSRGGD